MSSSAFSASSYLYSSARFSVWVPFRNCLLRAETVDMDEHRGFDPLEARGSRLPSLLDGLLSPAETADICLQPWWVSEWLFLAKKQTSGFWLKTAILRLIKAMGGYLSPLQGSTPLQRQGDHSCMKGGHRHMKLWIRDLWITFP